MQAVRLTANGISHRTDLPTPEPADDEVRVRVTLAGLCETDLQLADGYMGFRGTLGHEFVGIAETGRYAGRRVVGEINCPCGRCDLCRANLGTHCPHRSVLGILNRDGAFADFLTLPETNLLPVPDTLPDRIAVFAEPVAAACQIPAQVPLDPAMTVLVLGDGRLGSLCAQVLRDAGCQPTIVGKHREKLDRLAEDFDLPTMLLTDLPEDERIADLVVDCTGSASGIETAIRTVKPRGTIVLKTTVAGEQSLSLAPLVIDEITLIGNRCGPFDDALRRLEAGRVRVESLISETVPLSEAPAAFERARTGRGFKTLFEVGENS